MNRHYKMGELIMSASPIAHVVSMNQNGNFCDWCCMPALANKRLLRCSVCKHEHYCNKVCQRSAWHYHKFECPLLKRRYPRLPSDSTRLLVKLLWTTAKGIQKPDNDPGWRVFSDLCHHAALIQEDRVRMKQYSDLLITVTNYLEGELPRLLSDPRELLLLFGRMVFNSFTLVDKGQEFGSAVYVSPSVFDHSCDPNAVFVNDGAVVYVRAIKDIDTTKDSVYVNYTDPMQTRKARIKILRDCYFFTCNCNKCQEEAQTRKYEGIICPCCKDTALPNTDDTFVCQKCGNSITDSSYLQKVYQLQERAEKICNISSGKDYSTVYRSFLKENNVLSATSIYLAMVTTNLYAIESHDENDQVAYDLGQQVGMHFGLHYPEYFPAISEHEFKQARLAWRLEQYDTSLKHFNNSLKYLTITHGSGHHLTKFVQQDAVECKTEKEVFDKFNSL